MATPTSYGVSTSTVSLSGYNYIDSLVSTYKWGSGLGTGVTLPYSFPSETGDSWWDPDYYDVETDYGVFGGGLDSTERTAAISALSEWANVANIKFTPYGDDSGTVGDIRFA